MNLLNNQSSEAVSHTEGNSGPDINKVHDSQIQLKPHNANQSRMPNIPPWCIFHECFNKPVALCWNI